MPVVSPTLTVTAWTSLYPDIIAHIPRCVIPEIDARAREAARKFCRESHCWRERDLVLLTTVADQADYTYDVPSDAELWRVHSAWNGTEEIDVALPGEDDDTEPSESDSTWRIEAVPPDTLRISPLPDAVVSLTGSLSFIPAINASGLLTRIFTEHRYAIASGAVAMLASQPGKPWSNPAIVSYHQGLFDAGVMKASNAAGPVRRKPSRVKPW